MVYFFYLLAIALISTVSYAAGYERGKYEGKNGWEKGK